MLDPKLDGALDKPAVREIFGDNWGNVDIDWVLEDTKELL